MDKLGPRMYSRSVLRGYVGELRRLEFFDEVRPRASEELAARMDDPGGAPGWVGPATLDELLEIVGALRGREAVVEISHHAMRGGGFRAVLEPIIHLALSILNAGPESLLSRANAMASVILRGIEMKWAPSGESSGTMRLRCDTPVGELTWAAWEGVFRWLCELAGARGTVGETRILDDGRCYEAVVSWKHSK
jgi:hypothetical protein